jgi:surface antigen
MHRFVPLTANIVHDVGEEEGKMKSLFITVLAIMVTSTAVFGQRDTKTSEQTSLPVGETRVTEQTVPRIPEAKTLSDYATKMFPDITEDQIEPVLFDNNPGIRFDVVRNGRRFEMLIVAFRKEIKLLALFRDDEFEKGLEDALDVKEEIIAPQLEVAGCGGLTSANNPYPCCSNGGNCTWFGYYRTDNVWNSIRSGNGFPQVSFGNAASWATSARNYSYPVSSESGSRTIGVNSTMSSRGHVFFVEIQTWNKLTVSEMQCDYYYGAKWSVSYNRSVANKGFIYPKPASWRPKVTLSVSGTLYTSSREQSILFSGSNFTTDTIVDVVTPDGSTVSLSGSQLYRSSSSALWIYPVLGARGYWKFKVVGKDGQRSDWVYLWVN